MYGGVKILMVTEHECDSPKSAVIKNNMIGPFLFAEPMMTGEK
jgi:hypothetical protein